VEVNYTDLSGFIYILCLSISNCPDLNYADQHTHSLSCFINFFSSRSRLSMCVKQQIKASVMQVADNWFVGSTAVGEATRGHHALQNRVMHRTEHTETEHGVTTIQ
jgi:hypothetical protein